MKNKKCLWSFVNNTKKCLKKPKYKIEYGRLFKPTTTFDICYVCYKKAEESLKTWHIKILNIL